MRSSIAGSVQGSRLPGEGVTPEDTLEERVLETVKLAEAVLEGPFEKELPELKVLPVLMLLLICCNSRPDTPCRAPAV